MENLQDKITLDEFFNFIDELEGVLTPKEINNCEKIVRHYNAYTNQVKQIAKQQDIIKQFDEIYSKIKNICAEPAKRKCWIDEEDFNTCDFSGGNFDDSYYGGLDDGKAKIAKQILSLLEQDPT